MEVYRTAWTFDICLCKSKLVFNVTVTCYVKFQKVYLDATLHIYVTDRRPQYLCLSVHALLL